MSYAIGDYRLDDVVGDERAAAEATEQARREQREETFAALFKNAAERCQVNAPAFFADQVNEYKNGKTVSRDARVFEVLFEAADNANAMPEVFALLCNAAEGRGDVKKDAAELLDRMAKAFGRFAA